jgi:hypothetical protein
MKKNIKLFLIFIVLMLCFSCSQKEKHKMVVSGFVNLRNGRVLVINKADMIFQYDPDRYFGDNNKKIYFKSKGIKIELFDYEINDMNLKFIESE